MATELIWECSCCGRQRESITTRSRCLCGSSLFELAPMRTTEEEEDKRLTWLESIVIMVGLAWLVLGCVGLGYCVQKIYTILF